MKSIYLLIVILFASCQNYHNEMILWANEIPKGTDINIVKKSQPDFIAIDWQKPDTLLGYKHYKIIKIQGNRDVLNMSYFLLFSHEGKYKGLRTIK